MDSRIRFAVAGEPIEHSLSPELFALVAEHLGLEWYMPKRISAIKYSDLKDKLKSDFESPPPEFSELITQVTREVIEPFLQHIPHGDTRIKGLETCNPIKSNFYYFVSITTPLKHQFEINPINCLKVLGEDFETFNSDGLGFVTVARHFNIFPENGAILGLKGGGSTAVATNRAWKSAGGRIKFYEGRRNFEFESYNKEISEAEDIYVDYDDSTTLKKTISLNPRYGKNGVGTMDGGVIDGTWLLAAQHLISWNYLFGFNEELPSLGLLMSRLSLLTKKI